MVKTWYFVLFAKLKVFVSAYAVTAILHWNLLVKKCRKNKAKLFKACGEGEIDVIDELLVRIDPRRIDEKHQNLLSIACETYQPWVRDVVQRLLQAGGRCRFSRQWV